MNDIAIQVDNLSKRYRIGRRQNGGASYGSLRETLADAAGAPIRRLRRSRTGETNGNTDYIWALKNVSFEVKKGEVVGIIGRNGAGKTTLLKVLSRITRPTKGNVRLWGRVGSLLEVGTGFHPELTGRENIYLNGAVLGMKRNEIEHKFDEIVDFAEIEQFLDTPVKRYSSGMYMRLAFAVAAHLEPEILLVDEVLAVGDAAFQKKCLGKMGEVAKEGRTVLFVSHNMGAIQKLCDHIMWIDKGIILNIGLSSSVLSDYYYEYQTRLSNSNLDDWNNQQRPNKFFKQISINGNALPAEIIQKSGHSLLIRYIGDSRKRLIKNFRSGIHISTQDGLRIMSYATPWSSLQDIHVNGRVSVTCKIESLPLIPGKYYISIGCSTITETIDWLEDIALLTITPSEQLLEKLLPIYNTHGYFITNSTWEINSI